MSESGDIPMRTVIVDGQEVELQADLNLLQALEEIGKEIPRFCYHERLSVAGNCRMCLVELVGAPKPAASCHMTVADLRGGRNGEPPALNTASPLVQKARRGVMEFLLINHPLDCPICDQGGECDLQDQALYYGRSGSRFQENKRAVEDKEMGPLIKTIMTRCIQCTRCVRFATEVAGVSELGATGRGEDMEITTYLEKAMTSELSGNVIDLCPVGALTSKPYAFNARPWELTKTNSIDVMDAMGAWIRVDSRGPAVQRIMPRMNDAINEEWLSDKSRFVWDGLQRQRLDRPYVRDNGKLRPVSWSEALERAASALSVAPERIGVIAGDLVEAEQLKAARDLAAALGVTSIDARQDGAKLDAGDPRGYLFNSTFDGVEDADALLLIGTNPRLEAPVLNARIRKVWLRSPLRIGVIGEAAELTYDYEHLGEEASVLDGLLAGSGGFRDVLAQAERPMIVVGMGALTRPDGAQILRKAGQLAAAVGAVRAANGKPAWNGFNVLHTAAARPGALAMGFTPGEGGRDVEAILEGAAAGEVATVLALGADECDIERARSATVIYIGSHGDAGAHAADVILPAGAYTEISGAWMNMEGRVQQGAQAAPLKGEAKDGWAILRALSERLGRTLPYNSLEELRARLAADHPAFARRDAPYADAAEPAFDPASLGADGPVGPGVLRSPIADFYFTNPIARASKTLAECSALKGGAAARVAQHDPAERAEA